MPKCARCDHGQYDHRVSRIPQEGVRCSRFDRVPDTASGMPQFKDCNCKSFLPRFAVIGNDVWRYNTLEDAYLFYRTLPTLTEATRVCDEKNGEER